MTDVTPDRVIAALARTASAVENGDAQFRERLKNQLVWLMQHYGFETGEVVVSSEVPDSMEAAQREYLRLREMKSALEGGCDSQVEKIKVRQKELEQWAAGQMDTLGVESVTNRGVANTHFETKRRFTATDWAEVYKWILARGDFSILNKALNASGISAVVGDTLDMSKLPGVTVTTERVVKFNKA